MKKVAQNVLALLLFLAVIGGYLIYYNWSSPAGSCVGSFINNELDIAGLKKNCPNLTKGQAIQFIEERYEEGSIDLSKYKLLIEQIEAHY